MEHRAIEHPVPGWNPVPEDPDRLVWWDGTTFTHETVRTADGWEIVEPGVAVATPAPATGPGAAAAGGRSARTPADGAIAVGLLGVALVFVSLPVGILGVVASLLLATVALRRAARASTADHRRAALAFVLAVMELAAVAVALLVVVVGMGRSL